MSELNGFFSLWRPTDLVEKLAADFDRLRAADPTGREAQYAAFDFFVTAEHLPDWVKHDGGASLTAQRKYPERALASHIANGMKHFQVCVKKHTAVKDTRVTAGGFQSNAFQSSGFQVARLVIDLEDGTSADALEIAGRVLQHWGAAIPR